MKILDTIKNIFKKKPKVLVLEDTIRECTQTRLIYFEIGLNTLLACDSDRIQHTDKIGEQSISYSRKDLIRYIFDNCTSIPHHYQSKPGRQIFLMYLYSDLKKLLTIKNIPN